MHGHQSQPRLIWLASYPKSGNTWLRALLTNALQDRDAPADINRLIGNPSSSSRKLFDEWAGVKSSDLTPDEVERARPAVYRALSRRAKGPVFMKAHDAYTLTSDGTPLFPADATHAVIYVARHPADVAVSYAHHRDCTVDQALALMADEHHVLAPDGGGVEEQLPQRLLSWSSHVTSWLDSPLPVCLVRYEDLHADPETTLDRALQFAGIRLDPERIARAVRFAAFAEMQRQEAAGGFVERPSVGRPFFRTGKALEQKQLRGTRSLTNMNIHCAGMRRLGYDPVSKGGIPDE